MVDFRKDDGTTLRKRPLNLEAERQPREDAGRRTGDAGKDQQMQGSESLLLSCRSLRGLVKLELELPTCEKCVTLGNVRRLTDTPCNWGSTVTWTTLWPLRDW